MKKTGSLVALTLALVSGALFSGVAACSSDDDGDGKGTVTFTTWGEEYIEQEIPPKDADGTVIVEDGWSIKYEKFLIVISDVSVAEEGKTPAATMSTSKLFDMHAAGEKPVIAFPDLPGKAYTHVSYAVTPATASVELAQGATEADKQLMVQNGYSVYFTATASKDQVSKKLVWGFKTSTLYDKCKGELSGKETDGVVVTNGGNDSVQLTIHGDHFFYDHLQSQEAKVRFDTIAAADADGDGTVTQAELALVDLADPNKIKGGSYGTGSAAGVNDLGAFVDALSRTLGHFRGEGECLARAK